MNQAVVINGCAGSPDAMARAMAEPPGRDGTTILLYADDAARAALLPLVATPAVVLARVARYQPEQVLAILEELVPRLEAGLWLFGDDPSGRELAVRLAHRLGGSSLAGVRGFRVDGEAVICRKAVYSGRLEASFRLGRGPFCLAMAEGCAEPGPAAGSGPAVLLDLDRRSGLPAWIETIETIPDPAPDGLEGAAFILAVGMGAQTRDRAARLAGIARELGAELGASRPVVMNAWAPMHRLVGVSGALTRPGLCIVAGASGSAAFMAGIEHSRFIVALNQDDQAPIFRCCDVGAVGDCLAIMEELARIVRDGGA